MKSKTSNVCFDCRTKGKDYYVKAKALPIWFEKDGSVQFRLPSELLGLSYAEKMLIQRASPFIPLCHLKYGIFGLKGHVCAFSQHVNEFASVLPRIPDDVAVIKVVQIMKKEIGSDDLEKRVEFCVRKEKVLKALIWLKTYNREYKDIEIDESRFDWLGQDGVGDLNGYTQETEHVTASHEELDPTDDLGPAREQTMKPRTVGTDVTSVGVIFDNDSPLLSERDRQIQAGLKSSLSEDANEYAWPSIDDIAISEFDSSVRIFCLAFPWLFPGGIGDVVDYPTNEKQDLENWGTMMLYYEDGRFAEDQMFCFYAQNYIIRRRNKKSGSWFTQKFYDGCPTSLTDMQAAISKGDTSLMNTLTYYSRRVTGSNPYWIAKRSELYTWINHHVDLGHGAPMFFITLSCAEYYWPDVIDLLKDRLRHAGREDEANELHSESPNLIQLVNDYAVVIQEFFQNRVETFLETTGKTLFGIEHYWVRYEFTPGRGQIHAHLLVISNEREIFREMREDMNCPNGNELRASRLANWAKAKFGLNACIGEGFDDIDEATAKSSVRVRFSDVVDLDDNDSIKQDTENLKKCCMCHQCDGFCLRRSKHNG